MNITKRNKISIIVVALLCLFLLTSCTQLNQILDGTNETPIVQSETITPTIEITPEPTPVPTPTPTPEPIEPYVIAWMSDTQYYSKYKPDVFLSMTNWIAQNASDMNINYVIHTGDIVEDYDDTAQWKVAKESLSVLDGVVPLFTVAGNHDTESMRKDEYYINLFEELNFSKLDSFGGLYKEGRGRYDLFDINDEPVILISISYNVHDSDMKWMNQILKQYSDRIAILAFHGYLTTSHDLTTDGKLLYKYVVSTNENVKLVICGHRHGSTHNAIDFDDDGDGLIDRTVYQLLSNYQSEGKSGLGYFCLLSFDSNTNELRVSPISPYLADSNNNGESSIFEEFTIPWGKN